MRQATRPVFHHETRIRNRHDHSQNLPIENQMKISNLNKIKLKTWEFFLSKRCPRFTNWSNLRLKYRGKKEIGGAGRDIQEGKEKFAGLGDPILQGLRKNDLVKKDQELTRENCFTDLQAPTTLSSIYFLRHKRF